MKFTKEQKEIILDGLEQLLIQFTTKCAGSYKYSGLCHAVIDSFHPKTSYMYSSIQAEEEILLLKYIEYNQPFTCIINCIIYSGHYWTPYNYTPRIKYLRKHINKLKKELNII